jgi:hypothetical protein
MYHNMMEDEGNLFFDVKRYLIFIIVVYVFFATHACLISIKIIIKNFKKSRKLIETGNSNERIFYRLKKIGKETQSIPLVRMLKYH